MTSIRATLLACTGILAVTATSAQASVDQYTVGGESVVAINLEVCSAETQLAVRGDTGTDLDFVVTSPSGETIHTDQGIDDYFSFLIAKNGNDCATYALGVSNLGEEENDFTVVLEPVAEDSTRIQKYIIQANETQTIDFKACGTSASITARGDGDTDLDFIIRNSDGAVVHEDVEINDETSATLSGLLSDCETFEMEVSNLGAVYNALMLVVEPEGAVATPFAGTPPSTSLALGTTGNAVPASGEGAGEYRADANSAILVNMPVCGATRMEVRGDGDTDLDFTVTDSGGTTVHSDFDLSDVTYATLTPSDECETFAIEVSNLGGVYNVFTIALTDANAARPETGPGSYRINANAASKVELRVCSLTQVNAYGDGDTDLDFDVSDSSGESIHSDYDLTDQTAFTLDPGGECADYQMGVSNLGDVYNQMTVAFNEDPANIPAPTTIASPSTPPTPSATATAVAIPADAASGDGNNRNVSILNQTGEVLEFIYWSNSATLEWGEDKLGASSVLAGGQQWNVNVSDGSNACLFDFRAITASAREIEVTRVNVCEVVNVAIE